MKYNQSDPTDSSVRLPINDIIKIQEALLPLGYIVRGYKNGVCFNYFTLYLAAHSIPINYEGLSTVVNPITLDNPDNGFQGAK